MCNSKGTVSIWIYGGPYVSRYGKEEKVPEKGDLTLSNEYLKTPLPLKTRFPTCICLWRWATCSTCSHCHAAERKLLSSLWPASQECKIPIKTVIADKLKSAAKTMEFNVPPLIYIYVQDSQVVPVEWQHHCATTWPSKCLSWQVHKKRVEQISTTDSNQGNWQEEQRGEMRSDRWFGENVSSALNEDIRESPDAVFLRLSSLDD